MNRTGKEPRFKRQRRLQVELPGMGKPGAMARKPYPPGEHGNSRRKFSDYALQLEEKQKILYHYGLRETQLRRMVHRAKRSSDQKWVSELVSILEMRIDSLVFRLGFATSIRAAKQMVAHGKVLVNGKRLDVRSAVLDVGDKITLVESAYTGQAYLLAKQSPRLPLPDFLKVTTVGPGDEGRVVTRPALGDLPFPCNDHLVTSFYS